jgi:iron complex outermembrane receptor protein
MKTPILLSSLALSASSIAALPTPVNGQVTDAVQPTEVNGAVIDATQKPSEAQLDTVSVTADFRQLDVMEIPSAVTVIDKQQINASNASHLENILSMAPNVNFASGSSRARFFQIRGIGERSQFIDPVNPSVGLIIDGIDMTGLGGAATLFDIEQVEILRGPQGTAFGANALAGAINIVSTQPTIERNGYIKSRTGNYSTSETGAAISTEVTDSVLTRFAYNHLQSNGYTENQYQNRDDSNKFDEQVFKSITTFDINDNNDVTFTLLNANINNGYDAFSLTNDRNTYSDDQGFDKQNTTASSVKWINSNAENFLIETTISAVNTNATYSYDEDWSYGVYDSNGNCISECVIDSDPLNYVYSTFDEYKRKTNKGNLDIRILSNEKSRLFADSTDWILGIYTQNKYEKLDRAYTYDFEDPVNAGTIASGTNPYSNSLENNSYATYIQLTSHLSSNTQLTYGVRAEEWQSDFTDFTNLKLNNKETLFGGQISLESLIRANHLAYLSLARGYKAGGFNSDPDVSETNRTYKTETNNTAELGLKSSLNNDALSTRLALFYTERNDQQVKSSYIIPATDPNEAPDFQDYIANAAKGKNYGLEAELNWRIAPKVQWLAALGLLQTEFTDYEYQTTDGTFSKTGRDQAHAPNWTLNTSVITNISQNVSLTLSAEGKDKFYFSDSHDEQSKTYGLVHAQIKYQKDDLELTLTGRNLTDKDYATRGFGGFGNNPNNGWSDTQHTQLGEPRLVSVSAKYNF